MRANFAVIAGVVTLVVACASGGGDSSADSAARAPAPPADTSAGLPASNPIASPAASDSGASATAPDTKARADAPRRGPERQPVTPPPARRPPPTEAAPSGMDTARGIAAVVGAVPITRVIVRPPGARPVTVTGPLANEIAVASGAEVWVRGRRAADGSLEATGYAVRSVDGVTAITGTLVAEGDRLVLVTDDGRRHALARPPAPLRQQVGARVWVTGDPSAAITSFGILRPRR